MRDNPLAGLNTAVHDQSLPCGQAWHRYARGYREVDIARQWREVTRLDRHILRQGAASVRVCEAEYPLSDRQPGRAIAEACDHPGQFLPGDHRRPITTQAIGPSRRPRQLT